MVAVVDYLDELEKSMNEINKGEAGKTIEVDFGTDSRRVFLRLGAIFLARGICICRHRGTEHRLESQLDS